jgi:Tfp pilus assembly PilM family ATPase
VKEMYLNIIKAIHDKPIANMLLNVEKLKPLPLGSGMRQGCLLCTLLFNIVLEFLAREIRQEEEITRIGKKIVKLSLFADDKILYPKDLKISTKKLPDTINSFSKRVVYKINLQKSVASLYINSEQDEKVCKKIIPFIITSIIKCL